MAGVHYDPHLGHLPAELQVLFRRWRNHNCHLVLLDLRRVCSQTARGLWRHTDLVDLNNQAIRIAFKSDLRRRECPDVLGFEHYTRHA